MRKIEYHGTGATVIEGFGVVEHGGTIEVSDDIAAALCKENPADWKPSATKSKKPDAGGGE